MSEYWRPFFSIEPGSRISFPCHTHNSVGFIYQAKIIFVFLHILILLNSPSSVHSIAVFGKITIFVTSMETILTKY